MAKIVVVEDNLGVKITEVSTGGAQDEVEQTRPDPTEEAS